MLLFTQSNTQQRIVVTLTEKVTLSNPYFLFVFTHTETKQVVSFIKSGVDDISLYPNRYNLFVIDCTDVFNLSAQGEWIYKVYEQESDDNDDVSLTGDLLEIGKMQLTGTRSTVFTEPTITTTFKAYDGQ